MPASGIEETKAQVEPAPAPARVSSAAASMLPRKLTPAGSAHLDLVRAFAAWAVMWGHVRSNFFVDFQHIEHRNPALQALYFVTGFGHQAVMVFFVLSGFLISSSVAHSYVSGRWSWREYAINRASRLYVVLIPGLLLGLLWDKLGIALFSASGLYSRPLEAFGGTIAQSQTGVGTFIGNLCFLQTILCPTFGSNGPLWSLANEFWYYVLFPVVLFAGIYWLKRALPRALALTLLVACLAALLGLDKLIGFLVWLAGFGLVVAYSKIQLTSNRWVALYLVVTSIALVGCLVAARLHGPSVLGSDLAVGIACAFFLLGVLYLSIGAQNDLYRRAAHFFAAFSYSLYVLHFPFLLFLRAWILPPGRWQPDLQHVCFGAALGAATLAFAWGVSTFTEKKTGAVRQWLHTVAAK